MQNSTESKQMSSNRLTGIFFLVLSILAYFVLIPKGIVVPSNIGHFTTSPSFWPNIVIVIIALMSLLLMLPEKDIVDLKEEDVEKAKDELQTSWKTRIPRLLIILALLFAFYYSIEQFGMVVPGMALIFILMIFSGYRRWWLIILLSLLVPILLYGFFVHVANIPIPLGIFESLG